MSEAPLSSSLTLLPYGEDLLARLAADLISNEAEHLPYLADVVVLLPGAEGANTLHRRLLHEAHARGHAALLGPHIHPYHTWLDSQAAAEMPLIDNEARSLILVDALRDYRHLFGTSDLWSLADNLLALFDDLTANRIDLDFDLPTFTAVLQRAYGDQSCLFNGLEQEARLVHTLWHAWHEQLRGIGRIDPQTARLGTQKRLLDEPPTRIYLAGPLPLSHSDHLWLAALAKKGLLHLYLQGDGRSSADPLHFDAVLQPLLALFPTPRKAAPAATPCQRCIDAIFPIAHTDTPPLAERAHDFAHQEPISPLQNRLTLFAADSFEQEAQAVELQIRLWLLEGKERIAIITENRRLARRVRALLERADLPLQDSAGWALSTTSAASVLESWLECIEEDFPYLALLDLLKSPFLPPPEPGGSETFLTSVFRLEQDLINHENIGGGLHRYREALRSRQRRLHGIGRDHSIHLHHLFDHLEAASLPVRNLLQQQNATPRAYLDALHESITKLGLQQRLAVDAAGEQVITILQRLRYAHHADTIKLTWRELRTWIGRTLERHTFRPPVGEQAVQLFGLGQSRLLRFDALIVAGAEAEFLPGGVSDSPFFNDTVRRELLLPTRDNQYAERFYLFRALLEAAPQVMLSYRRMEGDQPITATPWVELLDTFHSLAYSHDLHDPHLDALVKSGATGLSDRTAPLPTPTTRPAPAARATRLPTQITASSYQQLIDCPYKFHVARCLGLAPPEMIREALEKSDYGEKVHRCLQAFHGDIAGLPGPWQGSFTRDRRSDAITLLEQIATAEFSADLEHNFLHRDWLQRLHAIIPAYIDWQIERSQTWQTAAVERAIALDDPQINTTLKGRLDRIDSDGERMAIIDYKTGKIPTLDEVLSGESIQLPFYRLLTRTDNPPVQQVEYLKFDTGKVTSSVVLEGEQLQQLEEENHERLQQVLAQMREGAALPAWGDEESCRHCTMAGVCRRQVWG